MEIRVVVVDGGKASSNKTKSTANSGDAKSKPKEGKLYKVLNYNSEIKSSIKKAVGPTAAFAINGAVSIAKQTARSTFDYFVSDIGRSTGDSNYQAIVNREIEVWTDGLSVVEGAASGAAAGSAFGPIGTAAGAVIGVVSSGISLVFKYGEREREYQHEMFKQNNSQAYQLARANYSAITGRAR